MFVNSQVKSLYKLELNVHIILQKSIMKNRKIELNENLSPYFSPTMAKFGQ
jgi:hypothetical protein